MDTESLEVQGRAQEQAQPPSLQQDYSLPQADGGKDAWLFLASAFIIEALVWAMVLLLLERKLLMSLRLLCVPWYLSRIL